jgi:hypothetical protein
MIQVEVATPETFEEALPLFAAFQNPPISPDHWWRLFNYSWPSRDRTRGFVLRDGKRIVGFFGTILYERMIDGRLERFADLTSWVTLPEYRNHSLRLFEAVASLKDRTLTCHTAIRPIHALYHRFGFKELENKWIVILPTWNLLRPDTWFRGRITTSLERILKTLEGPEAAYVRELESDICHPMLVTYRGRHCLIIFTRSKGRRVHFSRIHHIGNREIFLACIDHICWRLALANRTLPVAVDARLLEGHVPRGGRETPLALVSVYRSNTLRPDQIDNLYSELTVLGL